jgi:hypothetical protein
VLIPLGFVVIAASILAWTALALRRAADVCGDPPAVARQLLSRFLFGALAWIALTWTLAAAGVLRQWDLRPPPMMLVLVAILALGVAIARSRVGDRLARGVPLAGLVGLQSFRLPLEMLMHGANTEGLMPVQMSYSGRNFDILTGITALGLAVWLRMGRPPRAVVVAWNVLGLVLLTNIVVVAVLSMPLWAAFGSSPEQLNTFVLSPPYVLLPTVMVLAAWAGHLVVFRALRISPRRA